MSDPGKAVFLSYASQDAAAAKRVCEALRAAGVEVWFDQSELRGGDAWDGKIRKQIKDCALFVPVISGNTQARTEGYFRLEWRLADQRTHLMGKVKAFLMPVCIDDTRDAEADVPDSFSAVQWTRLAGGEGADRFAARVRTMLAGAVLESGRPRPGERGEGAASPKKSSATARWIVAAVAAAAAIAVWRPWRSPVAETAAPLSEARRLVAQARALMDEGDFANHENFFLADDLLKKAQATDETDGEVWAAQSQLAVDMYLWGYDRSKVRREAMRRAERAVKLAPKSIEAQVAYGGYLIYGGTNSAEEAVKVLQRLVPEAPKHKRLFRTLGQAWAMAGNIDEAAAAFDRGNAIAGGDPEGLVSKAAQSIWRGRYAEAEEAVAQSLALRPTGRGHCLDVLLKLSWRGDLDGAAAALARWPAWLRLEHRGAFAASQVWLWRREPDKAIDVLAAVATDTFNDAYFAGPKSGLLALAHEMAGRPEAARAEWENARRVATRVVAEDATARRELAWKGISLARLGESAAAEAILRELEQTRDLRSEFWSTSAASALLRTAVGRGAEVAPKFDLEPRSGIVRDPMRSPQAALRLNPVFDSIRATPEFQRLIETAPTPKPAGLGGAPAPPDGKSLAVLAFRQLSADPENEYLCEAISDELCNVLGRVPGLRVAASASSFTFKGGKRVRPAEMAAQLGVAYLVDGTVQKIGNRVRVRAQLIRAADESPVWSSANLEHEDKDMFAVQDEVVGAIAKNLQLQLGGGKLAPLTIDPEAYRLYYEGRRMWSLRGALEPVERARALFEQAVQKDSNLGRAYAGLADTIDPENSGYFFGARSAAVSAEVQRLTEKAIALEPLSAEAHTSHGRMLWSTWRLPEGERELRYALELNPNYAEAHLYLGRLLHVDGRLDESLVAMRKAMELDPLTSRIFDNYASVLIDMCRYEEALRPAERALMLQPESLQGKRAKLLALSGLGRHDEALAIARETAHVTHFVAGIAFARAGRRDEAREWLKNYQGHVIGRTIVLLMLGERDEALNSIPVDRVSMGAIGRWFYWPELDPVRDDPRFVRVLEQVGMKAAHDRAQAWRAAHPPEKPATRK